MQEPNRLAALFKPRSIAIVAAGRDPASVPGRPLRFLTKYGYGGDLYPVSRSGESIEGIATLRTVAELPRGVDLAIVTLPTDAVLEAADDLGRQGVRALVIFADGFSESGPAGQELERELIEIANRHGFVVLGPNTNGMRNWSGAVCATFATTLEMRFSNGPTAIVTQSGAIAGLIETLLIDHGTGANYVVDVGNEAHVTAADVICYLADEDDISSIGVVLEGVNDGAALSRAVTHAVSAGKQVAVLQTARSQRGVTLALSHTGALATDERIFSDMLAGAGAVVVDDEVSLSDFLAVEPLIRNASRVGCVSLSGGIGILLADAAERAGVELPQFIETAEGQWPNPHDLTARGMTEPGALYRNIRLSRTADNIDVLVVWLANTLRSPTIGPRLTDELLSALGETGCDVIVTGFFDQDLAERLGALGHRCFTSPSAAAYALGRARRFRSSSGTLANEGSTATNGLDPPSSSERPMATSGLIALRELSDQGMPVISTEVFPTCAELLARLENSDTIYPVVIKSGNPDLVHKQALGLVASDVRSLDEAREVCKRLTAAGISAGLDNNELLLQTRIRSTCEAFLGYRRHTPFGPVVSLGLGGTFVESHRNVSFCPVPVVNDAARRALRRTGLDDVLRQQTPDSTEPLEQFVSLAKTLARIVADDPSIAEVDLNPVMFDSDRQYAPAIVDAVIFRTPEKSRLGDTA